MGHVFGSKVNSARDMNIGSSSASVSTCKSKLYMFPPLRVINPEMLAKTPSRSGHRNLCTARILHQCSCLLSSDSHQSKPRADICTWCRTHVLVRSFRPSRLPCHVVAPFTSFARLLPFSWRFEQAACARLRMRCARVGTSDWTGLDWMWIAKNRCTNMSKDELKNRGWKCKRKWCNADPIHGNRKERSGDVQVHKRRSQVLQHLERCRHQGP